MQPAALSPQPSGAKAPRWAWLVATGFGSGRLRPASGTWGSAAAVLLWVALSHLAVFVPRWAGEFWFALLPIGMTWLAVKASDLVVLETGHKDPGYMVADEFAGQWFALWALRWELLAALHRLHDHGQWKLAIALYALPFLLFRILDIWKPWPARQIQALPGGTGIVADDVVAGLYAIPLALLLAPLLMRIAG
jgi:phosphatidylglycerophosphatase A